MDIIGESQAAPLYPLNLILSFFNIDVDLKYNILVCSYLVIGLVGIFFFIKKKLIQFQFYFLFIFY